MVGLVGVIDAVINVARRDVFDNVTILGVNSNRCKDTLKISTYILAKDAFKRFFLHLQDFSEKLIYPAKLRI